MGEPVKVVYLSHRVPFPADKGEKIRTFHQLKYLLSKGIEITVFSPVSCDTELAFAQALQEKLPLKVETAKLEAAWIRKAKGLLTNRPISETHFYSVALAQKLKGYLENDMPDAIVCTSSAMASYLTAILKNNLLSSRCRLLMDFMDLDSDKWQQYASQSAWPLSWIYQREARLLAQAELAIYQQFDHCFFISANETTLFSKRLEENKKVSVLANGIDTEEFYPITKQMNTSAPVFLFTGVMDYLPNEDAVLWFVKSCWQQIITNWPEAKFLIAGMQPSQKIQQLAKLPGITVTGYVSDILPFYHQADIFIAPFRLARGVQNKILQAMACGLPVLTTSLGAEGIACSTGEHLLIANTEAEIIENISMLLTDEVLANKLSLAGPKLIQQKYSWEGALKQLPELLTGGV